MEEAAADDFVRARIRADLAEGRVERVVTRFPPEPNGYLHIGHAKSICLNFGVAAEFGGVCNLRFDDTNPAREERAFIDAIEEDVRWLGFEWAGPARFASDYFDRLYEWAEHLVGAGLAYVDDLSAEEIRAHRGTLTEPGRPSPWRDRGVAENLDLFRRMRAGEFDEGSRVLRARIDMASGNMNLRDPILYRIVKAPHPRTGDAWCIYPTYDFAHGQSDAIEGVTHSLCTLEFADHRPLYEWLIGHLPTPSAPRQYEFSRLNVTGTVLSKRALSRLVAEGRVGGWDDPRMPTLRGLRRRGVPAAALRDFVSRLSVSRSEGRVESALLDHCVREHLNATAERRLAVLRPLRVVIEDREGEGPLLFEAANMPGAPERGVRELPLGREIWIEAEDFLEEPVPRFHRLSPGRTVRLRYAGLLTCRDIEKDASGRVTALRCAFTPEPPDGRGPDGRKPKATIHWLSADHAERAPVRLYGPLYAAEHPDADAAPDPGSLEVLTDALLEPGLADLPVGAVVQFERLGYFARDPDGGFNRTVGLRDEWARLRARG